MDTNKFQFTERMMKPSERLSSKDIDFCLPNEVTQCPICKRVPIGYNQEGDDIIYIHRYKEGKPCVVSLKDMRWAYHTKRAARMAMGEFFNF